jgi:hypothetical protein
LCGIIGIHFKNPRELGITSKNLEDLVDEMLLGIEHRGRDATGLLTVDAKGKPNLVKADLDAWNFIKWRDGIPKNVRTILGHTRFATQGTPQNLDNNHPVEYGTCFAIHNGHISNDSDLFRDFSLERNAEVDSEIIPALFDKFGLDKAHMALQELDGGFATAVVDPARFPNMTVLAKGWSSPVEVLETKHAVIWASIPEAIQEAAEKVLGFTPAREKIVSMKAGEIILMEGETVEKLSFKPMVRSTSRSSWSSSTTRGTSYSYSSSDNDLHDPCTSCGCARLWHGEGSDFTGACKGKQIGGLRGCRCIAFVEYAVRGSAAYDYCDGCGREFSISDLVKRGTNYYCFNLCAKDERYAATKTGLDLRQRAEDVIFKQHLTAEELSVNELDEPAWKAREEAVNKNVCEMAEEKCGLAANYIDWLINSCTNEIVESDSTGYLVEARRIAGKAYFNAWSQLSDEIEEIESAAWRGGAEDCPYGAEDCNGDCDECLGELGVVINIEDGQVVA